MVILWVSSFIVTLLPTLSSGAETLITLGGEYDGDLLLLLLLEVLVLGGIDVREVQAFRCSEPCVALLVLSRTHLFGVGDLLGVGVLLGVGDLSVLDFLSLLAGEGFSEYSSASLSSVSRVPRESVIRSPSSSLSCAMLSLTNASMIPTFGLSRQNYCYYPSFPVVSLFCQILRSTVTYPFTYFDTSAVRVLAHASKDA